MADFGTEINLRRRQLLMKQKDLAEALGCGLYVYEGYGHAVYDEAPDYLARVGFFLRGNHRYS